jgi:glycosyltransferase involved in cell wall biosynthesis
LSGETLKFKRITKKTTYDNYIFANISVTRRKNAKTLIQAFKILKKEYPQIKLIICGVVYSENAYYNEFKKDLNDGVVFCGDKSDVEIFNLYKNCLFSVYPSLEEGFGLPILESLWCNTPVICHNQTSTYEISNMIQSNAISCIDCLNVDELYGTMQKLMNKEYLYSISKQIKQIKIKSWYKYISEILNVLNQQLSISIIPNKKTIYYYDDKIINLIIKLNEDFSSFYKLIFFNSIIKFFIFIYLFIIILRSL